ncbi:MAG: hypothetical protein ACK5XN_23805, partial [Bacteroidota bacterium]
SEDENYSELDINHRGKPLNRKIKFKTSEDVIHSELDINSRGKPLNRKIQFKTSEDVIHSELDINPRGKPLEKIQFETSEDENYSELDINPRGKPLNEKIQFESNLESSGFLSQEFEVDVSYGKNELMVIETQRSDKEGLTIENTKTTFFKEVPVITVIGTKEEANILDKTGKINDKRTKDKKLLEEKIVKLNEQISESNKVSEDTKQALLDENEKIKEALKHIIENKGENPFNIEIKDGQKTTEYQFDITDQKNINIDRVFEVKGEGGNEKILENEIVSVEKDGKIHTGSVIGFKDGRVIINTTNHENGEQSEVKGKFVESTNFKASKDSEIKEGDTVNAVSENGSIAKIKVTEIINKGGNLIVKGFDIAKEGVESTKNTIATVVIPTTKKYYKTGVEETKKVYDKAKKGGTTILDWISDQLRTLQNNKNDNNININTTEKENFDDEDFNFKRQENKDLLNSKKEEKSGLYEKRANEDLENGDSNIKENQPKGEGMSTGAKVLGASTLAFTGVFVAKELSPEGENPIDSSNPVENPAPGATKTNKQ